MWDHLLTRIPGVGILYGSTKSLGRGVRSSSRRSVQAGGAGALAAPRHVAHRLRHRPRGADVRSDARRGRRGGVRAAHARTRRRGSSTTCREPRSSTSTGRSRTASGDHLGRRGAARGAVGRIARRPKPRAAHRPDPHRHGCESTMALVRSEGIVLKTHALGDTSRIVVVYTREHGMVRLVAKGARKTPSRFGFALEPLSRSRFVFYHKPDRDLHLLSQAETHRADRQPARRPHAARARAGGARADRPAGVGRGAARRAVRPAGARRSRRDRPAPLGALPAVTIAFELQVASLLGYRPRLDAVRRLRRRAVAAAAVLAGARRPAVRPLRGARARHDRALGRRARGPRAAAVAPGGRGRRVPRGPAHRRDPARGRGVPAHALPALPGPALARGAALAARALGAASEDAAVSRTAARRRRARATAAGRRAPRRRRRSSEPRPSVDPTRSLQEMMLALERYWVERGCVIQQPYPSEVGAGTFNPATFLRSLGPEPWRVALRRAVAPPQGRALRRESATASSSSTSTRCCSSRRRADVVDQYFDSLRALGIDPREHDLRLVEDDWESPTLGAAGLGWQVWMDGTEISQFTYFQQCGGHRAAGGLGRADLRARPHRHDAAGQGPRAGPGVGARRRHLGRPVAPEREGVLALQLRGGRRRRALRDVQAVGEGGGAAARPRARDARLRLRDQVLAPVQRARRARRDLGERARRLHRAACASWRARRRSRLRASSARELGYPAAQADERRERAKLAGSQRSRREAQRGAA